MTTLLARFNGQVLVPEEPVDLPQGRVVQVQVEENSLGEPNQTPLMALYDAIKDLPDAPTDGAAQHDHYLHGMPKRP